MAISSAKCSDQDNAFRWSDLVFALAYILVGMAGNIWFGQLNRETVGPGHLIVVDLIKNALLAATFGYVWVSVSRRWSNLGDWGFTLGWGALASIGLAVAMMLLMSDRFTLDVHYNGPRLLLAVQYPVAEELVFRVLLVRALVEKFGQEMESVFAAVLISAVAFGVVHVPIQSASEVAQLILMGIIGGYAYYYTRSCLFPAVLHVAANTSRTSGSLGVLILLSLYVALALVGLWMTRHRMEYSYHDTP